MNTFVRFHRKRTWHVVVEKGQRKGGTDYTVTACGEPSIGDGQIPQYLRSNVDPRYLCKRCKEKNP
jgi:hypothetical protein